MFVEQFIHPIIDFSRSFKERLLHSPTIEQFSGWKIFEKFEADIAQFGIEEARIRRRILIESNLKTYVQEAIGDKTIFPYATQVTKNLQGEIIFKSIQYNDVATEQAKNLELEPNETLRSHYRKEHQLWLNVWQELISQVTDDIGGSEPELVVNKLLNLGAKSKYLRAPDSSTDKQLNFNMDAFAGIKRLFPALGNVSEIQVVELPKKLIFASPSFEFYHDGQTTIGRHSRLVYIPLINEFVILSEGLFTGYKDGDIAKIHLLGNEPNTPQTKEELFWRIQTLATNYADFAPHAVFEELIRLIGHFDPVPTGEGVIKTDLLQRDLCTQITYLEQVMDLEFELCKNNPERKHRLPIILREPTAFVMQTALRDKPIDVQEHLYNYQQSFSVLAPNFELNRNLFVNNTINLHADFGTRVVSLVDCGTGTILGGNLNLNQLQTLNSFNTSLSSLGEVSRFCQEYNLDNPARFSTLGVCAMCGKETYIWPSSEGGCNVCPVCEAKDNLRNQFQAENLTNTSDFPEGTNISSNSLLNLGKLVNMWSGVNYCAG